MPVLVVLNKEKRVVSGQGPCWDRNGNGAVRQTGNQDRKRHESTAASDCGTLKLGQIKPYSIQLPLREASKRGHELHCFCYVAASRDYRLNVSYVRPNVDAFPPPSARRTLVRHAIITSTRSFSESITSPSIGDRKLADNVEPKDMQFTKEFQSKKKNSCKFNRFLEIIDL